MKGIEILEILEVLDRDKYTSSERLAKKLGIGGKTLRGRIGEIKRELPGELAVIEMKRGGGYLLRIKNEQGFLDWKEGVLEKEKKDIPSSADERVEYLLLYFLCHKGYIKRAQLCDILYVSEKTVTQELKKVEHILQQYGIFFEKRAHYGIRIVGDEFAKRQCLMNFYIGDKGFPLSESAQDEEEKRRRIQDGVLAVIREEKLFFSEMSVKCLINYIYISVFRIRSGFLIEASKVHDMDERFVSAADRIIDVLWDMEFQNAYREYEAVYLAIYLQGIRMCACDFNGTSNLVITEDVIRLVDEMLESVYSMYLVDMRSAFGFRMNMYKHLACMELRLQYGIEIKNPLLKEIKEKYLHSYLLAQQACILVAEKYHKKVSDDEVAYFAMLFELQKSQDEQSVSVEKKKILLVCAAGKTSSGFLLLTLMKKFGKDIEKIDMCSAYELEDWDLDKYDAVFTTIPISCSVARPVILIHDFLSQTEMTQVKEELLSNEEWCIVEKFYQSRFFFTGITGNTKEEVLSDMCARISEVYSLPDSFLPSVLYREKMGGTDFGNMTAIPHPYERILEEDLVSVGILKRPVLWTTNQVQIVILTAVSGALDEDIRRYFDITLKVISREDLVNEVLKQQDFSTFCKVLRKAIQLGHE